MQLSDINPVKHTDKLAVKDAVFISYFQASNEQGDPVYLFYAIDGAHMDKVQKLFEQSEDIQISALEQYGKVIASGLGEPTEEVLQEMEREYAINRAALYDANAPAFFVPVKPNTGNEG